MNFYERVYDITKDDNQAIEAAKAFQEIFRLQKTWKYRMVSPGGMLPGLLMPLLPKFVLDNKEEFEIPEDLASGIDDLMRGYGRKESGFIIAIMNRFISYLDHWMGLQNRLIASIYIQQEGDNFFSFLNESFCILSRLDLNMHRHPYAAYEALLEVIEDITRYEGRKSGELISERSVSNLMCELADIRDGDLVYDGACGYGISMSLAVAAMDAVPYMQDYSSDCTAVASILMLFAGKRDAVIHCGDTTVKPLTAEADLYFDRFITHPPFLNYSTEEEQHSGYEGSRDFLYSGKVPPNDRWLFVRNALARLKEDGVGVALVPISVLSRESDAYASTRKFLVWDGFIDSVIELPTGVVGSINTKWSIVVFRKDGQRKSIYMLDLSRKNVYSNFEKEDAMLVLREDAIDEIVSFVKEHTEINGMARMVSRDEIMQKHYRLSIGSYIVATTNREAAVANSVELWEERERLENEYERINFEFEESVQRYNAWLNQNSIEDEEGLDED